MQKTIIVSVITSALHQIARQLQKILNTAENPILTKLCFLNLMDTLGAVGAVDPMQFTERTLNGTFTGTFSLCPYTFINEQIFEIVNHGTNI